MPAPLFHLHDTLSGAVRPFVASDPTTISFYSCGPTVYDDAHIGNFRSFLAADLLRRWLESPWCTIHDAHGNPHAGPRRVVQVMNITDVGHMTDDDTADGGGEDKMQEAGRRIEAAKKAGKLPAGVDINPRDPYQIARFYESRFRDDARQLNLKVALDADTDATLMPRATESIAGMQQIIAALIEQGHAYVAGASPRRAVYFSVQTFDRYGELSGNTLDKLRAGEGGRVQAQHQSEKRHPADFLLWKEDPTHIMKWESPWGVGYPGWHIECSAMSRRASKLAPPLPAGGGRGEGSLRSHTPAANHPEKLSPPLLDLHSGGEDNIFPHHECEIAQSCCAFHTPRMASTWFHARFLLVEGVKMSKSKGNFYTARDLFAKGIEPAALRLELLRSHYQSQANFTLQGLADCQRMIDRWRRFQDLALASPPLPASGGRGEGSRTTFIADFTQSLADNLNIAGAIAALNTWISATPNPTRDDAHALATADAILGVLSLPRPQATTTSIAAYAPGVVPDERVEALLAQRKAARAAKDFAQSDAIRDQLAQLGYAIKDLAQGKVEVRRP